MNTTTCKTCEHFHQHYTVDDQSYAPVHCGHCVFPRMKHRTPDHKACEHYLLRAEPLPLPDRSGVIHFLTKEMLQHILELPLPPEVDSCEYLIYRDE